MDTDKDKHGTILATDDRPENADQPPEVERSTTTPETSVQNNGVCSTNVGATVATENCSSGERSPTFDHATTTTEVATDEKDATNGRTNSSSVSRRRSPSRDSSFNDDPKSLFDSISAASGRQNWSGKDVIEEDPSISSIKGDSVSATIADYDKKHRAHHPAGPSCGQGDNQSRTSGARLGAKCGSSSRNDDLSVNINLYPFPVNESSSEIANLSQHSCSKALDDVPTPTLPGSTSGTSWSNGGALTVDTFDMIEESNNASSCEDLVGGSSGRRQVSGDDANLFEEPQVSRTEAPKQTNRPHLKLSQQRQDYHRRHHHHHHKRSSAKNERRSSRDRRSSAAVLEHALEIDNIPQEASVYQMEPIILRGNGNLTLFGLSNSFSSEFPSALIGRVSKEEFNNTIRQINKMLREQQSLSAKLLLFGGLFCCCSLGFSLVWPSIVLRKRSKMNLEKFLASENCTLYSKLGLNWRLAEQRCYSNHSFIEYVIMIEFLPKENLYAPD